MSVNINGRRFRVLAVLADRVTIEPATSRPQNSEGVVGSWLGRLSGKLHLTLLAAKGFGKVHPGSKSRLQVARGQSAKRLGRNVSTQVPFVNGSARRASKRPRLQPHGLLGHRPRRYLSLPDAWPNFSIFACDQTQPTWALSRT
jgi:hypothetical protein